MQIITLDSVFCIEDLFFKQHKRFMAGVTIILLCIYVANCFCQNTFLVSFNEYLFNQCQCIEQTWWSFKVVLAQIDPFAPFATRSLVLYISWFTLQTFRASDLWAKALKKIKFSIKISACNKLAWFFSPRFSYQKSPKKDVQSYDIMGPKVVRKMKY
jgi:hypothetical protein